MLATQTLPQAKPKTMAVTVNGALPDGVTAKDLVLALITHTGTGGGQGYIVEYRGQAIEELSMEAPDDGLQHEHRVGRQGRADRARPDDLRLPRGPARGAEGRRLGRRRRALEDPGHRRRRGLRRGDRARRVHDDAVRHLGHQPRPGRAARRRRSRARRLREDERPGRRREGPGLHGPRGRHADARHQGRHGLRRLVHQRPDRGPARSPPRSSRATRSPTDTRLLVVPGLGAGAPAGRGRGPRRRSSRRPAPSGAAPAARCAWA